MKLRPVIERGQSSMGSITRTTGGSSLIFGTDVDEGTAYVVWEDGGNWWWPIFLSSFLNFLFCKTPFFVWKSPYLRFAEGRAVQELQNEYNNMGSIQLYDGVAASWMDPGKPNLPRNPNFWGVITFEPQVAGIQNLASHHFYTTTACLQSLSKIEEGEASFSQKMFTFAWNDPNYRFWLAKIDWSRDWIDLILVPFDSEASIYCG